MTRTVALAAALLLAVSCATTTPTSPGPDVQRIDRFAQRALAAFPEVPSLGLAVVRDGRTILTSGYGMRDRERQLPADAGTVYYIASSTKSYVGLLASILAARGVVDLNAPIGRYLPEVRFENRTVTLRTLLTHTAGIKNDAIVMRTAFTGEHTQAALIELLGRSQTSEPKFAYDNVGYVAAGLVLERVTGKTWQELLASEVFGPIGMTHTTATMSRANAWPLAKPYDMGRDLTVQPIANLKNDNTMHAAGGVVTTPRDLALWLEANVNAGRVGGKQVIPAAAFAEAHKQQVTMPESTWYRFRRYGYGLGWYHSEYESVTLLHHFGGYEGWRAHISFLPQQRHGVAAVVNTGGTGAQVRDLIAAYAYDVLLGKPNVDEAYAAHLATMRETVEKQKERIRADVAERAKRTSMLTHPPQSYAGAYANPALGTLRLRVEGNALRVSLGPLDAVLEPFTEPESARVELIPGTGEVLRFVFEGSSGRATAVQYQDLVFPRVE
ncbi:MAG TPA: serine hydrolase [Thermoanaerobaculia bacterium]|nr:serine hydrolase [Thermoanaerobaculia bacterium]